MKMEVIGLTHLQIQKKDEVEDDEEEGMPVAIETERISWSRCIACAPLA